MCRSGQHSSRPASRTCLTIAAADGSCLCHTLQLMCAFKHFFCALHQLCSTAGCSILHTLLNQQLWTDMLACCVTGMSQ